MMRPSLLRFQNVPTARASALRLTRPAPRCFSVMASTPRSEDERSPARRPQLTSLKDLRASALRTRLAALPTVDTTADLAASRGFASAAQEIAVYTPAPILGRFCVTGEVIVSKIFPAGFGWQGSSCVAEQAFQLKDTDTMFFVTTGIGDMVGVTLGHTMFYWLKKTFDPSINVLQQFQIGLFLGTAAFCSGAMWQPFVNWFQATGVGLSFSQAVGMTTLCCGSMFFFGLRVGRSVWPELMTEDMRAILAPTYSNLQGDMQLSLSVGAATGVFVGTDTSYGTPANWMDPVIGIGITDDDTDFQGMVKAGISTSVGFAAMQTVQNMVVPHSHCWLD